MNGARHQFFTGSRFAADQHRRIRGRHQLQSKRYEYNALLTTQKPDSGKIEAVAQEMEGLRQKLDQQRVKFDVALAEAGVPRGAGMGYNGCRGNGGGHRGMNHW
ncbi:TPA: periplasmic heavy metal sensor [Klebsiella variicola subsp. variicola]